MKMTVILDINKYDPIIFKWSCMVDFIKVTCTLASKVLTKVSFISFDETAKNLQYI